jgi:hypothetical protein
MVALLFTTIAPVIKVIYKVVETQGSHPVFGKNSRCSQKHRVRKNKGKEDGVKVENALISMVLQVSPVFFWFFSRIATSN